jgi:hypothetical protein
LSLKNEHFLQSLLPTTVVNLVHRTVQQTRRLNEYFILRREELKSKIEDLLSIKKTNPKTKPVAVGERDGEKEEEEEEEKRTSSNTIFNSVRQASPLITRALRDAYTLPTRTTRFASLRYALVQLIRRACTLIHYTHALRLQNDGSTFDFRIATQTLCRDLELTTDCFFIILALAEKISPGIYATLTGDPTLIENKMVYHHSPSPSSHTPHTINVDFLLVWC